MQTKLSDEQVEEYYKMAASIVADHGEKYLPIFERFHQEVQIRAKKNGLLETAKLLASR